MKAQVARAIFVVLLSFTMAATRSQGAVMVSNIDSNLNGLVVVTDTNWFASSFVTDNSAAAFTLDQIELSMGDVGGGSEGGFTVRIYSDSGNTPGTLLETLSGDANPTSGGLFDYTSTGLALSTNTTYWVVVGVTVDNIFFWNIENSAPTGTWTIPDAQSISTNGGLTWQTFTGEEGRPQMFSVSATPVPEPAVTGLLAVGLASTLLARKRRP